MISVPEVKSLILDYLVNTAHVRGEDLSNGASKLENLNVDSLSLTEMVWTMEQQYGINVPSLRALQSMTIDEVAAYIVQQLPAQAVPGTS
ncbi:MAG: acyl carrier protein [Proteobacteria bacterium]|nr:acyl carrier protein [Pseudomonadota bacterium]